ncbi:hypothetical protein ACT453_28055 [Bacillus sp. D-CC]
MPTGTTFIPGSVTINAIWW